LRIFTSYVKPVGTLTQLNYTSPIACVQNIWETVLDVVNAKLTGICIGVTIANEDLEIRVTIDGVIMTGAVSVVLNQFSSISALRVSNVPPTFTMVASAASVNLDNQNGMQLLKGRDVLVELRKTSAAGASLLRCRGVYEQW